MLTTAMLLLRSSLFLSLHLAGNAGSFPKPLSAEEEQRYLARCAEGDLDARNILVERNMRLVAHIIKKYYTQTVDQEDLISIGTIGLIKGISSYKPEKNVRLATYAARCIENEILMFFRSQKKLQGEVSLSETLETDKDGNNLFLMDVVGVEDTMLDDLDTRESHIRVRQLVDECLTEREADIIRQRYGLGGKAPRTQRELAAEYGISRSYVSRRAYCKRCPESLAAQGLVRALGILGSAALIANGGEFRGDRRLFINIRPLAKLDKAVKVADASNQRKAKVKTVSVVTIAFREDTKPFDKADSVHNKDTFL